MSPQGQEHTKSVNIKIRMYPQEKVQLLHYARQAGINLSELTRRVLLGLRLPTPGRHEAVKDIVKVGGDLSRLGNLLKLALDDGRASSEKIDKLIDGISELKEELRQIAKDMNDGRKL